MNRILTFSFFFAITPFLAFGQTTSDKFPFEEQACGSDEHHAYRMRTDPQYKERHIKYRMALDSALRHGDPSSRQLPAEYTIPIVVHIVHLGESIGSGSNISDAKIMDAIEGLNDRFSNANGMGLDIEIQFCLANRDPNGCPTSGINRVDGSGVPLYAEEGIAFTDGCGADEIAIKNLIQWPVSAYYNIWVVHDICGDIAGYAYYPNGDPHDGTVIDVASMNSSSRTLAHELGHGLNVAHTFDGDEGGTICPEDIDCAFDGDEICDTPSHKRNDCGINNPCGSEGVWDDSRYNWMSYCSTPREIGRFTVDQRTRMQNALNVWPRIDLLESEGCANAESMAITSDDLLMCSGEQRVLTAVPEGGLFYIADGPGTIEGNLLTTTSGGIIVVEYVVSLEECTSSVFQAINVKQAATSLLRSEDDSLCVGQSVALTGLPSGGTFSLVSGPGALEGNILTAIGEGNIELLYTVFIAGCFTSDDAVIVSNESSGVSIQSLTEDLLAAVPDMGHFQWVRCDLEYELIEGSTDVIYTVSTSGSYAVIMQDGVCSDTSDCIEVEITSVGDAHLADEIRIYPNPVVDVLYFEYEGVQSSINIILSDIQGQRLTAARFASQKKTGLNFEGLAAGIYLLTIEVEGRGRYYHRFVKV